MNNSLQKRIFSGLLAFLMLISNVNITASASETSYEVGSESVGSLLSDSDGSTSDEAEDTGQKESSQSQEEKNSNSSDASDASDTEENSNQTGEDSHSSVNLTESASHQATFSLQDWWYQNTEGQQESLLPETLTEDGQVTEQYDVSSIDSSLLNTMGFTLDFSCLIVGDDTAAQASDYLQLCLPSCFKSVSAEASEENAYYSCSVESQESGGNILKININEIPDGEYLSGSVYVTFSLKDAVETEKDDTYLFGVSGAYTDNNENYELILHEEENSEDGDDTLMASEDGDSTVVSGNFSISADIMYDEVLDGTDWSELVRPAEFDQPIKITQTYVDSAGQEQTVVYDTQDAKSKGEFYLKFTHDGEGGGSFVIANVPKSVKDANGVLCQVTGYSIDIEPNLAYYKSNSPITIKEEEIKKADFTSATGTLTLSLKSQTLTIKPTVVPENSSDTTSFTTKVSFTNSLIKATSDNARTMEATYKPSSSQAAEVSVPLGVAYSLSQESADGYRFDEKYTTTTTTDGTESQGVVSENQAQGTIAEGSDVTVTTVNYNQNVIVSFDVNWIDNEKTSRPSLSEDNFTLLYKTDEEWKELTKEDYASLNIEQAPSFDASQAALNTYSYKGLPAVDANDNPITYQVTVKKDPTNYVSSYTDDENSKRTFTFEEQTSFTSTILWNDSSNQNHRASKEDLLAKLKLYRRIGDGSYELVKDSLDTDNLTENEDGSWTINISSLARYNASNQEYDYLIVQGSIDENGEITQTALNSYYKTYYDNASGSFGNDTALCHNEGTITEVLYDEVDFAATKVWKDPSGSTDTRPTSTVTLWRYIKSEAKDLDDAYENGKAAQVVFQTSDSDGNVEEHIVSYQLSKEDTSEIRFTSETVDGLPDDYKFPAYDDQGQEYVYFVRESLSGDLSDDYDIQYTSTSTDEKGNVTTVTYKNGTDTEGTISNVRRKKEAVSITKIWQNPSGLDGIEGVSVQLSIQASADGGQTYDELTVYSDTDKSYDVLTGDDKAEAQTASGFTSTMTQGETIYYVNTYDSQGRPYDMTTARISETVTSAEGENWTLNDDGSVTDPDGNQYNVKTAYKETALLANDMNEYRYTQTNTITAMREYTLIKEWSSSISDEEIAKIASVTFTLERRSTKNNEDGSQADYEAVVNDAGENSWTVEAGEERSWSRVLSNLPKYDDEGYEYFYRATEVSFLDTDGNTITTSQAHQEKNWSAVHYRTPDQTKVVNMVTSDGRGFFTINKLWQDNGDTEQRKDITIRVYKKDDLKKALENLDCDESDYVNLDSLKIDDDTDLKYYSTLLKEKDQFTAYINYDDVDKAILGDATDSKLTLKDYVVFETAVGDSSDEAKTAKYSYGQLLNAASNTGNYSLAGTVSNSKRQYKALAVMNSGDSSVLLTNTRSGKTTIDVNKAWKDDHNAAELRENSIQFQLYRDGENYTNISKDVAVIANTVDGEEESTSQDASCKVTLDYETGVITVSALDDENTMGQWSFTVTGLDMFSESGIPYCYSMDEAIANSNTEADASTKSSSVSDSRSYNYTQKKLSTTVKGSDKTQTYTFDFENTISGSCSHIAYKYWKDSSVGAENRPDLYMSLYRYLKSDAQKNKDISVDKLKSYESYKGYKDQIWTREDASSGEDYETGYNWKITIEDLPLFNENGEEYVYVFSEAMNNDGKTVLGNYMASTETKEVEDESAGLSESYEVFTNTISGYMTVKGKKNWTGLAGYQTDELPDPLITLYRTVDPSLTNVQKLSDEDIAQLIKEGRLTKVDTTRLADSASGRDSKTQYSFPDSNNVSKEELNDGLICKVGNSYMLPKFDADGNRYTYLVRETIEDPISSQLYSEVNTNGTLSNKFRTDINRRKITVNKSWDRGSLSSEEDKYPSVTFTLYRYEAGNEENTLKKIASHTINSDEFTGSKGEASYTFDDLLIYSPTGVQYCYYIKEDSINGYSISYSDESRISDGSLEGSKLSTGIQSDGSSGSLTVTKDMLEELQSNDRIDIISLPDSWNEEGADNVTSVGTKNSYDKPGKVKISGAKEWNDYFNFENIRPSTISVTLTRHTNNESGQSNKVEKTTVNLTVCQAEDESLSTPYIVWNYGDDASSSKEWTYTIYNLPRYAANGMPYIYTLSEAKVNGYKKADDVSATANDDEISMKDLTNQFDGSYYVRKNWMDGNNKYNLRPENVTVKLQRSTDGGKTWSDMILKESQIGSYDESTGKWSDGYPSVSEDEDGNPIVSITLSKKNVIKNTKNSSWDYTFTNLPTEDKTGNSYTYRCVETAIAGVPIEESSNDDGTVTYSSGAYECEYITQNDSKTVIENSLDDTSLVVTKTWEGDQDDLYESRPDKLTFVLQKRSIKTNNQDSDSSAEDSLGGWENVLDEDGNPYTFTISKADNWTKTLEDLPTAEMQKTEDGKTYLSYSLYFRAVEVHADDSTDAYGKTVYASGSKSFGAQNYIDTTDYSLDSEDHTYNTKLMRNESTISNKLITDDSSKDITVTKTWRREAGASAEANFELLYKASGTDSWKSYTGKLSKKISSTDAGSSSFSWTNLPKYDKDGNILLYKVEEKSLKGYTTEITSNESLLSSYATEYTFTNIELQNYTVEKIWQNTDYAEKTSNGSFTAKFKLQKKVADGDWTDLTTSDVKSYKDITLSSKKANATVTGTWKNLPKYTAAGEEISYRAVETQINGKELTGDCNGAYKVTYTYGSDNEVTPQFADTKTTATNRMIYGFVNLSKSAAYLAPEITDKQESLEGVSFDIYSISNGVVSSKAYVTGVKTDSNGHLISSDGKYGSEGKYLVAGSYLLKESSTLSDYSVWADGIEFTVGSGKRDISDNYQDTGEHGTAWISTSGTGSLSLSLQTEYIPANEPTDGHKIADDCQVATKSATAVNVESRGVVSFTKTGEAAGNSYEPLNTHDGAQGEARAYFGVYLDKECTQQIAGMVPLGSSGSEETTMILTNKTQDGQELNEKNGNGIPYLRRFTSTDTDAVLYPYSLLSGSYYVKELTAPAGYCLDSSVRKIYVKKLANTAVDKSDLSQVYSNNKAEIMLANESKGVTDYQWINTETKVSLYKLDQFGRNASLKNSDSYLELKIEGDGNTFPTGENTLRLYQNASSPARKMDGSSITEYVTYHTGSEAQSYWSMEGLLEAGKTYTLSEPADSVDDSNIIAKSISFMVNADGSITLTSSATETLASTQPTKASGRDYQNDYQSDADNNILVLRDVSRYVNDLQLKKEDSETGKALANISFKLYKYESIDGATGEVSGKQAVLADSVNLTTDADGKINFSSISTSVKNQITGCALQYGLDVGLYYLEEIESGASDQYQLADKIYFEIKAKSGTDTEDYSDYAEVIYDTTDSSHVSSDGSKTVTVKNDPVSSESKTLELTKVDSSDENTKLIGGKFTLTYQSTTHGQAGSSTSGENLLIWNAITDSDGILYLADENWKIQTENGEKVKVDISQKGSYTLKEVQAPEGYITRTEDSKDKPVTLASFTVNSSNEITNVSTYDGIGDLVKSEIVTDSSSGLQTALALTVKNDKTKISVSKLNDLMNETKTDDQKNLKGEALSGAELEIYEGTDLSSENTKLIASLGNDQSSWNWTKTTASGNEAGSYISEGLLKEDTIYTLHESQAPLGYYQADDIYFVLHGSNTQNGTIVSQIYVWTSEGKPDSGDINLSNGKWSNSTNIENTSLTMVDPVAVGKIDLRKCLDDENTALQGAIFQVKTGDIILGTAQSNANGYLVWKSITEEGYNTKLIYNEAGKRVTSSDEADSKTTVIGQRLNLQVNEAGYDLLETDAPDQAYNDGRSYHASLTTDNSKQKVTVSYDRDNGIAINNSYHSTVTLHKYDGDKEGQNAAISGTEFTLYRVENGKSTVYKKAYSVTNSSDSTESKEVSSNGIFTTDRQGNLKIEIPEKGSYLLKESKAAEGYVLDEENSFSFQLKDKAETSDNDGTSVTNAFGYDEVNALQKDAVGVANSRKTGSFTLTKTDAATKKTLNGVVYTLSRSDIPKDSTGQELTDYLLKDSVNLVTGKSYEAEQVEVDGKMQWQLVDVTDSKGGTDGQISVSGLNWGDYTLTEKTELSGYVLEKDASGQVSNSHSFTIDGQKKALTFSYDDSNKLNSITLYKTNKTGISTDTEKGLAGAEFIICEDDGNGSYKTDASGNPIRVSFYTDAKGSNKVDSVVSGKDGKVTIYGLATDNRSTTSKQYHLLEVKAPSGYTLREDSVTFTLNRQGKVSVENAGDNDSDCQVSMTDAKSASFKLTKKLEGNMADKNKKYTVKMTIYKPDSGENLTKDQILAEKTISLAEDEIFDSETGISGTKGFGVDSIPEGAILVLEEVDASDYSASIQIFKENGSKKESITPEKGQTNTFKISLDAKEKYTICLTNTKDLAIDVGVHTENQAPLAAIALIIPAAWLAYRYKKKRKGGATTDV